MTIQKSASIIEIEAYLQSILLEMENQGIRSLELASYMKRLRLAIDGIKKINQTRAGKAMLKQSITATFSEEIWEMAKKEAENKKLENNRKFRDFVAEHNKLMSLREEEIADKVDNRLNNLTTALAENITTNDYIYRQFEAANNLLKKKAIEIKESINKQKEKNMLDTKDKIKSMRVNIRNIEKSASSLLFGYGKQVANTGTAIELNLKVLANMLDDIEYYSNHQRNDNMAVGVGVTGNANLNEEGGICIGTKSPVVSKILDKKVGETINSADVNPELSINSYFKYLLDDRLEIKSLSDKEQKVILLMENTALIWQLLLYKDEEYLCDGSNCTGCFEE